MHNFKAKVVQVADSNDITPVVTQYRPTHVVVGALWVPPEKFQQLQRLHPHVQWIVRNHSEMPFVSMEGIAVDWLLRYVDNDNVRVACNSPRALAALRHLVASAHPDWALDEIRDSVIYLPNTYHSWAHDYHPHPVHKLSDELHVGLFGAIRPLKNHLNQAIAAIMLADSLGKTLRLHINGSRLDGNADPILKNLRQLFKRHPSHSLFEHSWLSHNSFLGLVKEMDIGLQCSFSETFNIAAADFVTMGVPVVGSPEIPWLWSWSTADPTDTDAIYRAMRLNYRLGKWGIPQVINKDALRRYSYHSEDIWLDFLEE